MNRIKYPPRYWNVKFVTDWIDLFLNSIRTQESRSNFVT